MAETNDKPRVWLSGWSWIVAQLGAVGLMFVMYYQLQGAFLAQGRDDRGIARQELGALRDKLDVLHTDLGGQKEAIHELATAVRSLRSEVHKLKVADACELGEKVTTP